MATNVKPRAAAGADEMRGRIRTMLGTQAPPREAPASRVLATIRKPGYHAEQFELVSEREIRTPGWLLTPDNASASTPTVLYVGEGSAWGAVAEGGLLERLCTAGGCRVAVIDVRGRGDCAIAYPERGRFYFPNRITNEGYLTWFTMLLGRPLLGGQVYDTQQAIAYLRSRPDMRGSLALVGDGPHGVIALYAAALDGQAPVALRRTVTDYRSLATAERYSQPFGIYLYGVLAEFDLPDVAAALAPRSVLLIDPTNALGDPARDSAAALYKPASNVSVRWSAAGEDVLPVLSAWART
jgi:hypothetical protein